MKSSHFAWVLAILFVQQAARCEPAQLSVDGVELGMHVSDIGRVMGPAESIDYNGLGPQVGGTKFYHGKGTPASLNFNKRIFKSEFDSSFPVICYDGNWKVRAIAGASLRCGERQLAAFHKPLQNWDQSNNWQREHGCFSLVIGNQRAEAFLDKKQRVKFVRLVPLR